MSTKTPAVELGKRIQHVRRQVAQMTQDEFARALSVSRGAVGNWELGAGAKLASLQAIVERFPSVSLEWLSTGKGALPADDGAAGRDGDEVRGFVNGHYTPSVEGGIPEIDVAAGAGEGSVGETVNVKVGPDTVTAHAVRAEWLIPANVVSHEFRAKRSRTIVMPVVGDSMFPTYNFGDRVIIDLAQNTFVQDAVYLISDGYSAPRLKRLNLVFNASPRRVRIISDNAAYPVEEFPLDDVMIIGRVCGQIARR